MYSFFCVHRRGLQSVLTRGSFKKFWCEIFIHSVQLISMKDFRAQHKTNTLYMCSRQRQFTIHLCIIWII